MKICILGDSIAKGILYDEEERRYVTSRDSFAARLADDGAEVDNFSVFGCTVTKGLQLAQRHQARLAGADVVLMEFGGNDCDFHWDDIAAAPDAHHDPNTVMELYLENYTKLICLIQGSGAMSLRISLISASVGTGLGTSLRIYSVSSTSSLPRATSKSSGPA